MPDHAATLITAAYGSASYIDGERFDESENHQKLCVLNAYDPWDPRLIKYLKPTRDPLKGCVATLIKKTQLINGTLKLLEKSSDKCFYRCLKVKGELSYSFDKWRKLEFNKNYYLNCDFVETHCVNSSNYTAFRYIHQQVIMNKRRFYQKEDSSHASVFMLVFDSTSLSSLIRTITETNEVLRQYYDATTFYYHNKVALNTRPNGYAMFTGQRIIELDNYEFPENVESEFPNNCKIGPRRNVSVIYQFLDQNYITLIGDDWPTVYSYPNCKAYGKVIVDHYAAPIVLRMKKDDMKAYIGDKECQKQFHKLLQYADKFFNTYNGFAKFAIVWISLLTHDSINGLYFTDKLLANFFRRNAENLENSFVFVMGDHGLRHTTFRYTSPGEYEDNNPALVIAVPKSLRKNEQLLSNLRRNARTHTSHYDIYATLYDIARLAPKSNFEMWDEHDFSCPSTQFMIIFSKEFGEKRGARAKSLFRPIDHIRNCFEMEIPREFCICQEKWQMISPYDSVVISAGKMIIASINDILKSRNLSDICVALEFDRVLRAKQLINEPIMQISVLARPHGGHYEARVQFKENYEFQLESRVRRLDTFKKQSHCTKDEVGHYLCYCKKQAEQITEANSTMNPISTTTLKYRNLEGVSA